MDHSSVRFTARDAASASASSLQKTYFTYSRFANACRVRLKRFVSEHPEQKFLVYAVPLVLMGGALHEPKIALNHVIHELKRDGFDASYLGENLIFISWMAPVTPTAMDAYIVPDYVSGSVRPGVATVAPSRFSVPSGPGRPAPPSSKHAYRNFLEQQITEREDEYRASDVGAETRELYAGAYSHQDAMRNVVGRTYSTL